MPYEDPIEAALRALTDVEWTKRKDGRLESRMNATHLEGVTQILGDHQIEVQGELSAQRSGRYIATVAASEVPKILKAMQVTKAEIRPHRRKRNYP